MTTTTPSPFAILSSTTFGEFSRYRLDVCRDRFGALTFMVLDAERIDEATGLPAIIRQAATADEAVRGLASRNETLDARLSAAWAKRGAVETVRRADGSLAVCRSYADWKSESVRYERETGRTPPADWIVA